jgi:hypothetical protein
MSPAETTARRLIVALEEFTEQQTFALQVGNWTHAISLQQRAAPLIARLCEVTSREPGLAARVSPRLDGLMEARNRLQKRLHGRREQLQTERRRLGEARRRLLDLAPAYGSLSGGRSLLRLNATV